MPRLGQAAAAGLLSALLFLSLVKGIPAGFVLSYLAPLPLMAAGLALGQAAAAVAVLVAAAATMLVAGEAALLPFSVVAALPALLVSNRALLCRTAEPEGTVDWYPPGLVLAWLTAAGLVLMAAGLLLIPGHPEGARGWVAELIVRTLEAVAPEVGAEARQRAAEWWAPMFPGMVVGSWLVMAVVNATAAQGLLVRLGRHRRPSPAYRQLELPVALGMVLAVAMAVASLAEGDLAYGAGSVAAVALVPFLFLGLAGIHQWVAGRSNARMLLAMVYGVLFLAFGWAAIAVAGLGVVRFLMRLRRHP